MSKHDSTFSFQNLPGPPLRIPSQGTAISTGSYRSRVKVGNVLTIPPWTDRAACADVPDPDIFFPPGKGRHDLARAAKAICAGCPVKRECLNYALCLGHSLSDYGIWGGLTPRDRRGMKRGVAA